MLRAILRGTEEGVHDTGETHTSLRARASIPLSHSHSKPESLQEEEVSVHASVTTLHVQFGGKNACHARVRARVRIPRTYVEAGQVAQAPGTPVLPLERWKVETESAQKKPEGHFAWWRLQKSDQETFMS